MAVDKRVRNEIETALQCLNFKFASILRASYALNVVVISKHNVNQDCCAGGVDDGALNATTVAMLCSDSQNFRQSANVTYCPMRHWESGDRMAPLTRHSLSNN
eukprot:6213397-Pleurochrysis_carterae.AAC.1